MESAVRDGKRRQKTERAVVEVASRLPSAKAGASSGARVLFFERMTEKGDDALAVWLGSVEYRGTERGAREWARRRRNAANSWVQRPRVSMARTMSGDNFGAGR